MLFTSQRFALFGLALGPSLVTLWMVQTGASEQMVQNSAPFAVVSSVLAAISVWIYGTFPAEGNVFASSARDRPARLLRPLSFRHLPKDLPDQRTMMTALTRALANVPDPVRKTPLSREPERPESVMRMALAQVLESWGVSDLRKLGPEQIVELYLLHEIMHLDAIAAGKMAQMFLKSDNVLLIHEQITSLRRQRQVFDEELAAFEATMELWNRQIERHGALCDLRDRLEAMPHPDADLWHRLVISHNPSRPEHRDAALWIASQPECHKATVAAFLWRSVTSGQVEAATRGSRAEDDRAYPVSVLNIIKKWNYGFYARDEIGLDPEDMLSGGEAQFRDCLDEIAKSQGSYAWPMPENMFRRFPGRAPAQRPNWNMTLGKLVAQPRIGDYVQYLRLKPV